MPTTIGKEHPKRKSTVLKAKLQTCTVYNVHVNPTLFMFFFLTFQVVLVTSVLSCGSTCSWKEFTFIQCSKALALE